MITLYGSGKNRWVKPYWTLRELGQKFEVQVVRPLKVLDEQPDYLKINPFAKVPALKDGDFVLYESAAICTYLADKFPEKSLIPKVGTKERGLYNQWVSFIISDLEQPLWRITKHKFIYPQELRSPQDIELARKEFAKLARVLDQQITDFLVGGQFSTADIMMTYTLNWAKGFELIDSSKLLEYVAKHNTRPAFPKELYV